MKFFTRSIQVIIWITVILVSHSQMVSSSGAVSTDQISTEAVSTDQISSEAISTDQILSEAVSTDQISQEMKQKVMVDFDVGLTMVDSIQQKITKNRKIFQTLQCKKCKQVGVSEVLTAVGLTIDIIALCTEIAPFIEVVGIVATVGQLFYSIVNGGKIGHKLDLLNDKLDDISREMNSLREELKASIEFNDWLTKYIDYEFNIRNGEECLNDTLTRLKSETNEKMKMKIANEYLNCFERNLIEESAENIYRLTGKPPSPTTQNLFDLFVKEKGCDILEISRLMMILRDLMTSAAKQSLFYYFFKDGNENRAGKSLTKYQSYLYDIRDYYNNQAWHCFRDSVENAKSVVKKTIDENNDLSTDSLTLIIHQKLSSLIPWYSWTVAQFEENEAPDVTVHPLIGSHFTFTAEGETYFPIKDYSSLKRNILVVWQDSEDIFRSCDDIYVSSTKVYFKPCKDCHSGSFVNSDNMIEEHMCNEFLRDKVRDKAAHDHHFHPNGVLRNMAKHPVSFVSANIGSHNDACINNPCLNEGICKSINYTNSRFCMCKPFYEGINCENDIGNSLADNATYVLGKIREHFGIVTGIPDVIDIYFQIKDLATDIKHIQQSLQYYSEYANLVSLYGKSIKDAEYISNYYHDFQSGKLEVKNFGELIDTFNFNYISLDFGQMITGDAILVRDDFLTSKKKILAGELLPCTKEYSNAVTSLMRNLVTLDQVVVESMIWHARWKISNTLSVAKKSSILSDLHQAYEYAIKRQKLYFDNWYGKSCPQLHILNANISGEHIYCDKGLSYEGINMHIDVRCMDYTLKTSSSYNVTCMKGDNEALEWVGKPKLPECHFAATNWSDWTECSATCGDGLQFRYRSINGQIEKDKQSCISANGDHLCTTGVCIWQDQICDGNDNCGNDEDENDCSYLRVGDTISLSNSRCGHWLSCPNENLGNNRCTWSDCGSTTMNSDDWTVCSEQVFDYVAAENRNESDAIRHGDRVGFRYHIKDDKGWWLTCQDGDKCETHNCPGPTFEDSEYSKCTGEVYWILSEARTGNCDFSSPDDCIGEPIQYKDTIRLLHDKSGTGMWVSSEGTRLKPCDVRHTPADCYCEQWEIHIKRLSDYNHF